MTVEQAVFALTVSVGAGTTASLVSNYVGVRRDRAQQSAQVRSKEAVTSARIDQVAREGERLDHRCLSATRSIEAATAVTAAITVLSIQLLHKSAPTLTVVGFTLAATALGLSLVASLLVLSSPIQFDERNERRQAARQTLTVESLAVAIRAREQAWLGFVLRVAAILAIVLLVAGAIACMGIGQFSVAGPR